MNICTLYTFLGLVQNLHEEPFIIFFWDEIFDLLIYSYVKWFKPLCEVVWNDKNLAKCFRLRSRSTSLSCPLRVSMIIKISFSFRYLRLVFTCFKCVNTTFLNNSFDFFCIQQEIMGKRGFKISREIKFRETSAHTAFRKELKWRKVPVMLTVRVAVTFLFLFMPLIGSFFAPGETYDKGVCSRFRLSSFGISCSRIIGEIHLWKESFSPQVKTARLARSYQLWLLS